MNLSLKFFISILCILAFCTSAFSVEFDGSLTLSPDSLLDEAETSHSKAPKQPETAYSDRPDVKHSIIVTYEPDVLLLPMGEINSSFSRNGDTTFIQELRNAINSTQLYYKSEDAFLLVSSAQTTERVQTYLAQAVHARLLECGINNLVYDYTDITEAPDGVADFLYRIELGVNRVNVSQSLLSTRLTGEAEANIIENNKHLKKILVNSYNFADNELRIENQAAAGIEKDLELKSVTSRLVDRLADRMGDKLCRFF